MHGIGYHLLGDFSGISDAIVTNKNLLMAGFQELLSAEGLTIVKTIDHQFIPHGLTGRCTSCRSPTLSSIHIPSTAIFRLNSSHASHSMSSA